ncbi:MAG: hypothetical protein ACI3XA_08585 [Clostridia bacterium]
MGIKARQFADDGWGIWIDGDDRSTVYLNEWINPKGKSYVDVGVRIYGAKEADELNIYVPFKINSNEITDLSGELNDRDILRGLFNTYGIVDAEKNKYTSEIKYDSRIVSLIKLYDEILKAEYVADGTVIKVAMNKIRQCITSDEAYVIFRIPHITLDKIFVPQRNVRGSIERLKELISTPTVTEKYGYSIRINEARLLPCEINKIEVLHQQRIRKALITISINEEYELNDSNCYRIRRMEEDLYKNYAPLGFDCSGAITYQWVEARDKNMKAHFNFYFDIVHSKISPKSVMLYVLIILVTAVAGSALYDLIKLIITLLL